MVRYENDRYQQVSPTLVGGNPWFICSLWLADYLTEKAAEEKELAGALEIMKWVSDHALPSGVLAEQINPLTGEPLSVSPSDLESCHVCCLRRNVFCVVCGG